MLYCGVFVRRIMRVREFCDKLGEMSEWFKERAWKVRIPQKGIAGSNPALSAKEHDNLKLNEINKLNTKQ